MGTIVDIYVDRETDEPEWALVKMGLLGTKSNSKERVRLTKDTVTDEHEVSEEVRKEQIEEEGEIDDSPGLPAQTKALPRREGGLSLPG